MSDPGSNVKPRLGSLDDCRRKAMEMLGYDEAESRRREVIADDVVERFLAECRTDPDLPTYFRDAGARFEAWRAANPGCRWNEEDALSFGELESEVRDFYQHRMRQIVWLLKPETLAKIPNRAAWPLVHIVQERIKRGAMI